MGEQCSAAVPAGAVASAGSMRYTPAVSKGLVGWPGLRALSRARALRALVIGCGAGDDAEELSRIGLEVVAFDAAPTAVVRAKERFPDSRVRYEAADLLAPPRSWRRAFDFVFAASTLQSLPPATLPAALDQVAGFVAPGGTLLVLARGRDDHEIPAGPPWPLAPGDLERFERAGLELVRFEDFTGDESPQERRFRVEYRRSAAAGS
jgi:SAM-dependent methyltransferase